jgi:tRNA A37 methylthiotransferase MiaB
MPDQVRPEAIKRRSRKLIGLGRKKKRAFLQSIAGTSALALVQGPQHRFSRFSRSLTGNYCEVFIRCPSRLAGSLQRITITHYSRGRLYGRLLDTARRAGETREESKR